MALCRPRRSGSRSLYNAVLDLRCRAAVWLVLARGLPPIASTMSVMLIPVLGTVSGAWWLHERAALAGRRGDRADAGRDRLGDVAERRAAPAAASGAARPRFSRNRGRRNRARASRALAPLHRLGVGIGLSGPSPAHAGCRARRGARSAPRARCRLRLGLARARPARTARGRRARGRGVVEGEHVGRMVLAAELAVQRRAFGLVDDAHA